MAYIYLIENGINGHKYVGQTMRSLKTRLQMHWSESKRDSAKHRPLYRAFKKHGIGNFKVKILERCDQKELNEREVYWIDFFNTFKDPHGYNCTEGGEGGEISDEVKERIAQKMREIPRGEKWEKSMSKSLKAKFDRGEKWGFMAKKYDTSSMHKRKVKGYPVLNPSGNQKTFAISDKVLEFDSGTEAAKFLKGKTSAISNSIKYGWTAYGYKWEKVDKRPHSRPVYGIHKDTEEKTEVFPSTKQAALHWGKRDTGLRKSLKKPGVSSFMRHYWYYDTPNNIEEE
tara:strand:- start:360 stop:1214 length:855 start_codon:yes stop_codon:yes gene_type:complete